MWTSNGLKYLVSSITLHNPNTSLKLTTAEGSTVQAPYYQMSNVPSTETVSTKVYISEGRTSSDANYQFSLLYGTGTTAPTLNDYKLENLISNDDFTFAGKTVSVGTDGTSISFIQTHTNNTSSIINISEIGVYVQSYSSNGNPILIIREVLDTPIAVEAGKTKAINFTIDLSKING